MTAAWDVVECDFDGDETGNFGKRQESGSALFQVDTIAVISPSGQVTSNPHVIAAAIGEDVCIAAASSLSLFQDNGHKFSGVLGFDSDIEVLSWTKDAAFLVLGEQCGKIHFIDPQSQRNLFSKQVLTPGMKRNTFQQMFFTPITDDGTCKLIILAGGGQIHIYNNVKTTELLEAIAARNMEAVQALQAAMTWTVVDTSSVHSYTSSISILGCAANSFITAGTGDTSLCVWVSDGETFHPQRSLSNLIHGSTVNKMVTTASCKHVMVLDSEKQLSLWKANSLSLLRMWSHVSVSDFIILEEDDDLRKMKVVILTEASNGVRQLQICKMPTLTVEYSLQLSEFTTLADCALSEEALYVIEGVAAEKDQNGDFFTNNLALNGSSTTNGFPWNGNHTEELISSLRLRTLVEAQPDTRFSRLLHKKNFDEAEKFAKQFNLDVELVYKVKCNSMLDKIAPWNATMEEQNVIQSYLQQLEECLRLIKDDAFVVACCLSASPPTFEATLNLLRYAQLRLTQTLSDSGCKNIQVCEDLLTKVLKVLHRIATFQIVFGIQNFRASDWSYFQNEDMLSELLRYLTEGDTDAAFTLWRRHQSEFEEDFQEEDVLSDMLASIPMQIFSEKLIPWLSEDLIPFVIKAKPVELPKVASWLEVRARRLETMERSGWPQNAINLCELLESNCISATQSTIERNAATPKNFATQVCNLSVGYSQVRSPGSEGEESSMFVRLHTLIGQLRDLHSLHDKYHCYLSLEEYVKETTESLTYRMLDRVVAIELIPSTIEKVVRPYMKEHSLSEDKMLFQYIEDLAARAGKTKSCFGEAPWEAKAIAVIDYILDPDYKCRAIRGAIERARVPWSPKIQALVDDALVKYKNHPRVTEIENKCKVVELHKMLMKYELHNIRGVKPERLLCCIISHDRPTVMEDSSAVINAFGELSERHLYESRFTYLIQNKRVDECMNLLTSLTPKLALESALRVVRWTCVQLDERFHFCEPEERNLEKVLFTYASCRILSYLLTLQEIDSEQYEEFSRLRKKLKNISSLQLEFSEFVSLEEYVDKVFCYKIIMKHSIAFFHAGQNKISLPTFQKVDFGDGLHKNTQQKYWSHSSLYRLGELLGLNSIEMKGELAIHAANTGDPVTAIKLTSELYDDTPCPMTGRILYRLGHVLCKSLAQRQQVEKFSHLKDLPAEIMELANRAVTLCEPGLLPDCLELTHCTALAGIIARQCESGDYGISVKTVNERKGTEVLQDVFREWTFTEMFKEDGLVMDSCTALPLVYDYTIKCLPCCTKKNLPYEQDRVHSRPPNLTCDSIESFKETSEILKMNESGNRLVEYLKDNSQVQLSHCVACSLFTANVLHTFIHQTCSPITNHLLKQALEHERQISEVIFKASLPAFNSMVATLLAKIFNQLPVDHGLGLALTLTMPKAMGLERLKKIWDRAGHHYKRVTAIAGVAIDCAHFQKEPKMMQRLEELKTDAEWGHRLAKCDIPFAKAFTKARETKEAMLPVIAVSDKIDVQLIKDYCATYHTNEDDAVLLYLTNLLLPKQSAAGGDNRKKIAQLERAREVFHHVSKDPGITKRLGEIHFKLDSYDYESLDLVLTAINERAMTDEGEKALQFLKYIQRYTRLVPPNDYEVNYRRVADDEQMMCGSGGVSDLANSRLPFHAILYGDPWKVISKEIMAKNIEVWFPIFKCLKLCTDQMYALAIKNELQQHVDQLKANTRVITDGSIGRINKAQCNWNSEDGVNEKFFTAYNSLLMQISVCDFAMACSQYVVTELPMGAEKVVALRQCVELAQRWADACPEKSPEKEKAQSALKKFTSCYWRLSTEQVLFHHQLGSPDLIELAGHPDKLIFKLYEHESILRRGTVSSTVDYLPDIHHAVDDIAKINNVDAAQIRVLLTKRWLPSTLQSKQDAADMTLTFDAHVQLDTTVRTEEEINEDEVNLKRVVYILQHSELHEKARFLLNYAFVQDTSEVSHMCRVRALRCLFSLVDDATIEKISNKPVAEIKEFLQTHLYLVEFERLRVPQTYESFTQCNKTGLVRGLFRNHSHQQRAVRLVADICLDYSIYDMPLWNSILQQLMAFRLLDYVRHVLVSLSRVPDLWQVDCIQRVWHTVLMHPITSADAPLTEEEIDECLRCVSLLHRCPLLLEMDVLNFARHFTRLELPICALSCLLFIHNPATRDQHIALLFKKFPTGDVLEQLTEWRRTRRTIPLVEQIENTITNQMNEN